MRNDADRLADAIQRYREAPGNAAAPMAELWLAVIGESPFLDHEKWEGDLDVVHCKDGSVLRVLQRPPWAELEWPALRLRKT